MIHKYKVGDWVYILDTFPYYTKSKIGQIEGIVLDKYGNTTAYEMSKVTSFNLFEKELRPATKLERVLC